MVVVVGLEEGRGVPAEMQRGGFFCARIKGFVSKNYKIGRCLDMFVEFFITLRSEILNMTERRSDEEHVKRQKQRTASAGNRRE
jgi:hypothetical protein